MSQQQLMQSFLAFNQNALNELIYVVKTNVSLIMTIAGVLAIMVMNVKDEIETFVDERQTIL